MKNLFFKTSLMAIALASAGTTKAQIADELIQNTKFGGYVIGKYNYNDQDKTTNNGGFDFRLGRVYVDSKLGDFTFKLQMEIEGAPENAVSTKENTVRTVDAWAEWGKYKYAKVRFGQFKRSFMFENPMNPWDIGYGAYSQVIMALAGFNDRVGEHSSNGRDLGVQLQGDLIPVAEDKHPLLHYQVGVFNGQGTNHTDKNKDKDVIGGLWFNPVKELSIGAFGWAGNYTENGITVDRNRLAFGMKYDGKIKARAEYISSEGHKISDYDATTKELKETAAPDKADGWYATIGVPVTKQLQVWAKWDVYRANKTADSQKTQYALAANYYFNKNLKLQGNYYFNYDKTAANDKHYNTVDLQLYWRF